MYGRRLAPFVPVPREGSGNRERHQGAADCHERGKVDAIGERPKAVLDGCSKRGEDQAAYDGFEHGPGP